MAKRFVMIAGPNGAGKSTFYEQYLTESGLPFVNADLIAEAAGLPSYDAAEAASVVRRRFVQVGASFIAETVFSDPVGDKLRLLREAMEAGFEVMLIYIGLESSQVAQTRVDYRVGLGGHDVPDEKIAARFSRSLENLKAAILFVPEVQVYDNSSGRDPFRHVAEFRAGQLGRRMKGRFPRWTRGLFPTSVSGRSGDPRG